MYTYDTRVTLSCTGPDGLQTTLSVITLLQDCSMLWMESEPAMAKWLEDNNAAMMVGSRQVDIIRRPAYGEKLQVRTWIYQLRGKLGYRNTVIVDENGECTAKCWAIGVFVTHDSGKMLTVPDNVIESLSIDPKVEMEYLKRKIVLPQATPIGLPPIVAVRSDIDFNGHVNNAQYVRMAYELLPEHPTDASKINRLRIQHEGQAKLGDTIYPVLYHADGIYTYVLNSKDAKPFAIVEFS